MSTKFFELATIRITGCEPFAFGKLLVTAWAQKASKALCYSINKDKTSERNLLICTRNIKSHWFTAAINLLSQYFFHRQLFHKDFLGDNGLLLVWGHSNACFRHSLGTFCALFNSSIAARIRLAGQ